MVVGAIAQFEREIILERQREGIANPLLKLLLHCNTLQHCVSIR